MPQLNDPTGCTRASVVALVNSSVSAENLRDVSSISGLGRSPGGGHGNPPHYSFLEKPVDRGARQAMGHWVAKGWTRLKYLSTQHAAARRLRLLQ